MSITAKFSFSFEFQTLPPETLRGEVTAPSLPSCARNAIKLALQAFPNRQWTSCVLVLDRYGLKPGIADVEPEATEAEDGVTE